MEGTKPRIEFAGIKRFSVFTLCAGVILMGLATVRLVRPDVGFIGVCFLGVTIALLYPVSPSRRHGSANPEWYPTVSEIIGPVFGFIAVIAAVFGALWVFVAVIKWMWMHS